jgi:hypothetical protein
MASRRGWFKHFMLSTPARSHADLGAPGTSGASDIIVAFYFDSMTERRRLVVGGANADLRASGVRRPFSTTSIE